MTTRTILALGAATLACACGWGWSDPPEPFDPTDPQTAPHHGTRAGHLMHETELALDVNDRNDYARKIDNRLASVEQWAATLQQDEASGNSTASPEIMGRVQDLLREVARARARLEEVNAIEGTREWRREGHQLHEEVEQIELEARRIGAQRGVSMVP